jgi:hypothetical protein
VPPAGFEPALPPPEAGAPRRLRVTQLSYLHISRIPAVRSVSIRLQLIPRMIPRDGHSRAGRASPRPISYWVNQWRCLRLGAGIAAVCPKLTARPSSATGIGVLSAASTTRGGGGWSGQPCAVRTWHNRLPAELSWSPRSLGSPGRWSPRLTLCLWTLLKAVTVTPTWPRLTALAAC